MNYRMLAGGVVAAGLVTAACNASHEAAPVPSSEVTTPFTAAPNPDHAPTIPTPTSIATKVGCTTVELTFNGPDQQPIQPETARVGDIGGYVISNADGLVTYGVGVITETGPHSNVNVFSQFPKTFGVTNDANRPFEIGNQISNTTLTILPQNVPNLDKFTVEDTYCFLPGTPKETTAAANSPTA